MLKELKKIKCGKILENVDLSKYTTYKINNVYADVMIFPADIKELENLLFHIKNNNIKYKIIGGGSNIIFKNDYSGILINLSEFNHLKIEDTRVIVGAGYPLMKLALKLSRLGYTGLEFATGIPGTVGGAIYGNAGAYLSDMGYVIESIVVLTDNLEIERLYNKEVQFHYRTSLLKENPGKYTILEATIIVEPGDREKIIEIIEDRKKRRLMDQPLEYPSAGSVFRNPKENYAGKLIEDIGLKGKKIGGAEVSNKHANFILNTNKATGKDIVELIELIQKTVKEKYDIELILEQEIIR